MNKTILIISFLLILSLSSVFADNVVVNHYYTENNNYKEVPCYDNNGNWIQGVICIEENIESVNDNTFFNLLLAFGIIYGIIIIVFTFLNIKNRYI